MPAAMIALAAWGPRRGELGVRREGQRADRLIVGIANDPDLAGFPPPSACPMRVSSGWKFRLNGRAAGSEHVASGQPG